MTNSVTTFPERWEQLRAKYIFRRVCRPAREEDQIVTAFRDGVVTARVNRRLDGFTESLKEIGYQGVRMGDLVVHSMDGFAGAIGVRESDGKCSPVCSVCTSRGSDTDNRYYAYLLRTMALNGFIRTLARGIRERSTEFRYREFAELDLPVPSITEQRMIAGFLDRETTKVDRLVEDYRRLVGLVNDEIASRIFASMNSSTTHERRLRDLATIVSRPVVQRPGELYTPIGLFNRGRGLFHKNPREMDDMGDSDFLWIKEGDLIISGQFAWEGAVVLAGKEDSGCVVSHRYHILRGRDGIALTEYLLALLATKHGDFLLNENSRGAAGRNRPLNINSLLKEKIPVPDLPTQEMVAKAVHRRIRVLCETFRQIGRLQEYRSALISAAVTGRIDVRNYRPQEAAALCQ